MIAIRPERAGDQASIRRVLVAAFAGWDEANLVEALRRAGDLPFSLVAVDGTAIVGHVAASPVTLDEPADAIPPDAAVSRVVTIAPLAVMPDRHRRGIGTALMDAMLDRLRGAGVGFALLLGDPAYYRRFGFAPEKAADIRTPFDGPHQMAVELRPGALAAHAGLCHRYAPAFAPFLPRS